MHYPLSDGAASALCANISSLRRKQPHFANARSIRNALDRARLRQANRLFEGRKEALTPEALSTIKSEDIRASRVFGTGAGP